MLPVFSRRWIEPHKMLERLMKPLLIRWGFPVQNIVVLTNDEATRERVVIERYFLIHYQLNFLQR